MPFMSLEQVREAEELELFYRDKVLTPEDDLDKMFELWMFRICWTDEFNEVTSPDKNQLVSTIQNAISCREKYSSGSHEDNYGFISREIPKVLGI